MTRVKQLHDRLTIMPRINTGVAQRFIRNSLWTQGDTAIRQGEGNWDQAAENTKKQQTEEVEEKSQE